MLAGTCRRGQSAPVIVVQDKEGIVSLLIAASGIGHRNAPAALVHAPHPEFDCDGITWPVLEIVQDQCLQHTAA